MPNTPLLTVAIPSPLRRSFHYLAPSDCPDPRNDIPVGCRVRVPFGQRELIGIVIGHSEQTDIPADKLKPVIAVLERRPLISPALMKLTLWAASYYQHPLGDSLQNVLPVLLRKGESARYKLQTFWQLSDLGKGLPDNALRRSPKQQQLLQALQEQQMLSSKDLQQAGLSNAAKTLANKGLIESLSLETHPHPEFSAALTESALPLNKEQATAVREVCAVIGKDGGTSRFQTFLLDGITGSGKTEVYLQIIHHCLQQGKQALLLVPEIGLTPQTVGRFRRRFQCHIAVFHSGLSDRERLDSWLDAARGRAGIVIGTRSAIFSPLCHPGVIIIDEEHDASFKQQEGFRYSARDLAVMRGQLESIPVVLGSATPSLESLYNAQFNRYQLLRLTERAGQARSPEISVLDIRRKELDEGFSQQLIEDIRATLERGDQALVFLNRRGFATTLMCDDCAWISGCEHCDARMTVHQRPPHLHCHHCNHQQPVPKACPCCQSTRLHRLGQGTERSEAALRRLFPDQQIFRIDRDSIQGKAALDSVLEQINEGKPAILIGTQMLAKGHHFPHVTLVAILDADAGLFSPDFRGPERMGQLLIQVAGRAGREDKPGYVRLQTRSPEHPWLNTLLQRGYHPFAQDLLGERQAMGLPPCSYMALFRAEHKDPERARQLLRRIRQQAESLNPQVSILGPLPAPLQKKAGQFRYHLLLQASQRSSLQALLGDLCSQLDDYSSHQGVRCSVDVDPQDMY